jgi:glycosyltransferase involved in cell wall biosynthesis
MPPSLTISIAMCTYNGEKFLQEQLDSFLRQTRLPDELVVCDDASQDGTGTILKNFADQAPFIVRLFKNEENLGYAKNFEKAVSICQGDIIAFSDQDDIWLPNKLLRIEDVFQKNPDVGYVFSDASIVDEHLKPYDYSLWDYCHFKNKLKEMYSPQEFTIIFTRRTAIYGLVLACRRYLCNLLLPFPEYWAHDEWIPFIGSILSSVVPITDELVKYRHHDSQYSGVRKIGSLKIVNSAKKHGRHSYLEKAIKWKGARDYLTSNVNLKIRPSIIKDIEDKIEHYYTRANIPYSRVKRIFTIVKEYYTGRYSRFSSGWKSVVKDLILLR